MFCWVCGATVCLSRCPICGVVLCDKHLTEHSCNDFPTCEPVKLPLVQAVQGEQTPDVHLCAAQNQ